MQPSNSMQPAAARHPLEVPQWFLLVALATFALTLAAPRHCAAEEAPPPATSDTPGPQPTPSILGYALEGFGTGAAAGLATGYLLTGSRFEAHEWRTLVWCAGIGALGGLGLGLALGMTDTGTTHGAGVGFYMMRDSNLGVGAGLLAGGVIGGLIWAAHGTGKDFVRGLAWGTVIGAGSGLLLGAVEGSIKAHASSERERPSASRLRLGFSMLRSETGALTPYPTLNGRF